LRLVAEAVLKSGHPTPSTTPYSSCSIIARYFHRSHRHQVSSTATNVNVCLERERLLARMPSGSHFRRRHSKLQPSLCASNYCSTTSNGSAATLVSPGPVSSIQSNARLFCGSFDIFLSSQLHRTLKWQLFHSWVTSMSPNDVSDNYRQSSYFDTIYTLNQFVCSTVESEEAYQLFIVTYTKHTSYVFAIDGLQQPCCRASQQPCCQGTCSAYLSLYPRSTRSIEM